MDFGIDFGSPEAPKIYVFDFDQTILRIHSYGSRIKADDVARRNLSEDVADKEFFQQFVASARHAGSSVAVASFGEYQVIQNYLDLITPNVFDRTNVCTPSCVGGKDGYTVPEGKVPMMEHLIRNVLNQSPEEIKARTVLFDDQPDNIERAQRSGYIACFTPDAFTRQAWPSIREFLPKSIHRGSNGVKSWASVVKH